MASDTGGDGLLYVRPDLIQDDQYRQAQRSHGV